MAVTETLYLGTTNDKLYNASGQFTSTIRDSLSVGSVDTLPEGISWDNTNTPWCGSTDDKLYLESGKFAGTLKTSEAVAGIDSRPTGISFDGTNTPWTGRTADKLYLQSGQFTGTLKTSRAVSANTEDIESAGIAASTHTFWCYATASNNWLFYESGQFSGTIRDSENVNGIDTSIKGISWDGVNTPWVGTSADKLYLQSSNFTATLKTSIASAELDPFSISHDDFSSRMGTGGTTFERTASISATGTVTTTTVREAHRTASIAATGAVTAATHRELSRTASISATGEVTGTTHQEHLRTASISASGIVTATGGIEGETPPITELYPPIGGTGRVLRPGGVPEGWEWWEEPQPLAPDGETRSIAELVAEAAAALDIPATPIASPPAAMVPRFPAPTIRQPVGQVIPEPPEPEVRKPQTFLRSASIRGFSRVSHRNSMEFSRQAGIQSTAKVRSRVRVERWTNPKWVADNIRRQQKRNAAAIFLLNLLD